MGSGTKETRFYSQGMRAERLMGTQICTVENSLHRQARREIRSREKSESKVQVRNYEDKIQKIQKLLEKLELGN